MNGRSRTHVKQDRKTLISLWRLWKYHIEYHIEACVSLFCTTCFCSYYCYNLLLYIAATVVIGIIIVFVALVLFAFLIFLIFMLFYFFFSSWMCVVYWSFVTVWSQSNCMNPHSRKPRTWQVSIIWQGNFHRSRWRRYRLCGFSPEVCGFSTSLARVPWVSFHACPRTIAPKVGILGVGGSNLQRRIGSMCATVGLIFLSYSLDQFATHSYWTVFSWCRQTVVSIGFFGGARGWGQSHSGSGVIRGLGATTGREVWCWTLVTLAFCVLQSVVRCEFETETRCKMNPDPS